MAASDIEVKKSSPDQARGSMPPAPADPWRSLRSEMDRLFDRFSGAFGMPSLRRMFGEPMSRAEGGFGFAPPAVDVAEDDHAYRICAELPGLDENDIDVTVTGDMLVIKGEKKQESERKDNNYHMTERAWGSFQRSFALPEAIDRDHIAAHLSKGVLTVTLPKKPEAQNPAKRIEVKAG